MKKLVAISTILLASCGGGGSGGSGPPPTQNLAPVAQDDSASTFEGQPVTIAVLANDSDPEGSALSISSVTPGSIGAAVINPDRTISFTPGDGMAGNLSFEYAIADAAGLTARATIRVAIGMRRPVLYIADEATPGVRDLFMSDGLATTRLNPALGNGERVVEFKTGSSGGNVVYATTAPSGGIKFLSVASLNSPGTAATITPAFDAGSRVTLFAVNRDGTRVAYVVEDGTVTQRLFVSTLGSPVTTTQVNTSTQSLDLIQAMRFSPDGADLLFQLTRRNILGVVNTAIYRAATASPTTIARVTRLAVPPESVGSFEVSPDGRIVVYRADWFGRPQLVQVNLVTPFGDVRVDSTGEPDRVTVDDIVFSSDSSKIIFRSFGSSTPQHVYVATLGAPGVSTRIANTADFTSIDTFRFAAAADLVVYRGAAAAGGAGFGWSRPSAPGATVERLSDIQFYDISADGQVLAYGSNDGLLQRFIDPAQQGVLSTDGSMSVRQVIFSSDGRYVAYVRTRNNVESVRVAQSRPPNSGAWRILDVSRGTISSGVQQIGFAAPRPY